MQEPAEGTGRAGRVPGSLGGVKLFGVPVRFHFTFWLVAVWLVFIGAGGKQSWAGSALYVLGLFASVLLHEFGHAAAARRFRIGTLEIVMLPLGGVARLERQPQPAEEFWVALSGPLVNLLLGGGLLAYTLAAGGRVSLSDWYQASDANLAGRLAAANLILAGFNLLPAFPMDGGRVLRSLLARRRPLEEATRIAARVGTALAALIGLYGLLTANFVLVFVAFFIYVGAMQESLATAAQALMQGASVGQAMITDFRTLGHGDTIREAASLLLATSQQDFPVLNGPVVTGLLTRSALLRAMAEVGPDGWVAGAMDRAFARLRPDMDLRAAAPLVSEGGNCALVSEGEQLVGLPTSENLSEYLVLRRIREERGGAAQSREEDVQP